MEQEVPGIQWLDSWGLSDVGSEPHRWSNEAGVGERMSEFSGISGMLCDSTFVTNDNNSVYRDVRCDPLPELARSGVGNALHHLKGVDLSQHDTGQDTPGLPLVLKQLTKAGSGLSVSCRRPGRLGTT